MSQFSTTPSNLVFTPGHHIPGSDQVDPIVFLINGSGLGVSLLILFLIGSLALIMSEGQGSE